MKKVKYLLVTIAFLSSLIVVFSTNQVNFAAQEEPYFATEYTLLEPYMKVMEADKKYLWAAGGITEKEFMKILYRSVDYGDTWEKVYQFDTRIEGMHVTYNNVLIISTSKDRWDKAANGELWRSDNQGKDFHRVLKLESGAASNWNITSDTEGYIFVSEYGYKSLPNNARRIYRSKDHGLTWEKIYEPEEVQGYHNHVITIDQENNNTIYQVIGDNVKKIIMSTDRGNTWEEILSGYHPTSALQIDQYMLWGLDNLPYSGIIRYDLETGDHDYSLITPKPYRGSIYDMLYVNNIIYAGLLSYAEDSWDGSIFISKDKGETWDLFATWPKISNMGIGFYEFTTIGDYGYIWVTLPMMKDGIKESYQGTLRFKLVTEKKVKRSKYFPLSI